MIDILGIFIGSIIGTIIGIGLAKLLLKID